jgi:hypothetical protein
MSNYLAVPTVTAVLTERLRRAVELAGLADVSFTFANPGELESGLAGPHINVFLFDVEQTDSLRNRSLSNRDSTSRMVDPPQVAVNLNYMLSFYGNEGELGPERCMAIALACLHTQAVVGRKDIEAVVSDPPKGWEFLQDSDLAAAHTVNLSLSNVNVEEMARIWSLFQPAQYRLSLVYKASVLFLGPDTSVPVQLVVSDESPDP